VAAKTAERDLLKLPTWARHRIEALQADLEIARRDLAMALGGTGIVTKIQVEPYNDGEKCYLPAHATVRYWIGPRIDEYVDVHLRKVLGRFVIELMGSGSIVVEPSSSNVAHVLLKDR
jgi:hypothetical protein